MGNKKIYLILAAVVIIGGFVAWGLNQPEKAEAPAASEFESDIIYYYGEECPHCQDVAEFLEENKIAEKVNFSKKEVWHNQANKNEMNNRAKECGLDISNIGVPFLYARGECLIGTPNVTGFFKKEAGI